MKKLVSTLNMSREQWLAWRRIGIGGSDAAALVGLSPWNTPFSVYADKKGLIPDTDDNEAMRQGRDLENYVASRFSEVSGKRVRRCNAIIQHDEHPFLLANVDRMIAGEDSGLECKTMNPRSPAASALQDGNVPPQYYVQCQHYMSVTGYSKWYLAILVLGTDFHWFEIPRHEDDIKALVAAEIAFWEKHIECNIPPAPDETPRCEEVLKQIYPNGDNNLEVSLSEMEEKLRRLNQIKSAQELLKNERRGIENVIRAEMKYAARGHSKGYTVYLDDRTRASLDVKALFQDHPDIYKKYCKTTTYRTLSVKEDF